MVTRPQAYAIFAIGTIGIFNFGKLVFKTVMQFTDGGLKSTKLPYPYLIYGFLKSQGFIRDIDEDLSDVGKPLKIASALFKGHQKVDLPGLILMLSQVLPTRYLLMLPLLKRTSQCLPPS